MAPVAVLLSSIQYLHCSNAAWPYEYSATEWIGMPASRTPESQWGTRSPPFAGLCLQTDAHPQNTGRHPCLIAANRTPCRRNQRARLQSHTHSCCLKSLRIRVEARANVAEREEKSRQLQLMQASVQHYPTEDLNTADTSCPSRTSAEHFDDRPGPCPENERSHPCTNVAEPATMVNRPHRIQLTATHAFVDR